MPEYKTLDGSTVVIDNTLTVGGDKFLVGTIKEAPNHEWRLPYVWRWNADGTFFGYKPSENHPLTLATPPQVAPVKQASIPTCKG